MGDSSHHISAIQILRSNCFPTYGSERSALLGLWWSAQKLKAVAANGGAPLSVHQTIDLCKRLRCDGDRTDRKLDEPCINGPPNLGYAY